ncbi:MAG: transcriptional regulator [Comamonadaceae bacterium]|nr:MAG: transcriptional regulator [Comamonadaceae bacterium]
MNNTRQNFDNSAPIPTSDRILFLIKSKGPVSTARLAQVLDMTPEAARQQVQKLVTSGQLEGRQEAVSGVGRPRQIWVLTEAGNRRFPDTHAQLTAQLIGSVRQIFGEEGLDRLIAQRESDAQAVYRETCTGRTVPERLEQLAAIRTQEGYMTRVERDGGDWMLIEDHCPICVAARTCQGFCRSELQLFQDVVGQEATVTREQHLLSGATRCAYRITLSQSGA